MLPVPTVPELAAFSGRPVASYSAFAAEALTQATLMFSVATKLQALPDNTDQAQLARYAILEMADRLLLEQPFQAIKASPFQSETAGSYSYSRTTQFAKTVSQGLRTGLFWWDTALEELTVLAQTVSAHGSIKIRQDGLHRTPDGEVVVDDDDELDYPPYVRIS